ncbi:hypothetical protein QRB37_25905, partial [Mycobacterium avium subsp. hominissuis]|uniref:hypothetical protein n=1 Tax=Mycobacterium avium TaxID=1764 RepID=UPI002666992D
QFLVTLTVHTNKINPTTAPQATSARSMTTAYPVVVIPRDGQHPLREIQPQTIESLPLVAAAKADFEVVCEDGCEHLLGRRVALF